MKSLAFRRMCAMALVGLAAGCYSPLPDPADARDSRQLPLASQAGSSRFPLEISGLTVDPQPAVGRVVELTVEIRSSQEEADVTVLIQLPQQVELTDGDLIWRGSLRAHVPCTHSVRLRVLTEGDWRIDVNAISRFPAGDSYGDYETLHLVSQARTGEALTADVYRVRQPSERLLAPHAPTESSDSLPAESGGEVTIAGILSYEATEDDGTGATYTVTRPVGRVLVELYDQESTGDRWLATVNASSSPVGFYTFTVPNEDPDGSGIDPYLRVFADDQGALGGRRAQVVDEANHAYVYLSPVIDGGDLTDGPHPYDHTIPESDLASQAFYIFDRTANAAYEFLQRETDWEYPGSVQLNWPDGCVFDGWGSCFNGQIFLDDPDGRHPDVIIHEYGHFVLSQYGLDVIGACFALMPPFRHYMWEELNPSCAWSEGWADYFEMAVQGDADYIGSDLENVDKDYMLGKVNGDAAASYEGVVAASLWDIFDTADEAFDQLADGFDGASGNGIWHLSTTDGLPDNHEPRTINQFWAHWLSDRPSNACYGSVILQHHKLQYEPFVFTLATSTDPAGAGSVSVSPAANCPANTYADGTNVTLTAVPASGYVFDHWSGNAAGTSNPLSLAMDSDKAVAAHFVVPTPTPTSTPVPNPTHTPTRTPPAVGYFLTGPYLLTISTVSGTQYAYGINTVQQPAGSSFVGMAVQIDYSKTFFKDAQDLGYSPRLHGNSSPWDHGPGWYCRTRFSGPEHAACVYAASQLGVTFATPRPTSYWNDAGAPGSTIYSAFGIESVPCCKWPPVTGHLTVYYIWNGVIPSPTPGATPSPTPTSVATPTPTPTPAPCGCFILCRQSQVSMGATWRSAGLAALIRRQLNLLRQTAGLVELLQEVRDQVLAQTSEGQRLIDLYEDFSPNLAEAILPNPALTDEGDAVLDLFVPGLQALVEGRGGEVAITQEQVDAVETFLDHVAAVADPDLQQAIAQERSRRPLQAMVGSTMDQAWQWVNGYSLEWLPPLDSVDLLHVEHGEVVAVAFTLGNHTGEPVLDPTVALYLIDIRGTLWLGPIGLSSDPDEGLVYGGMGEYHFNLPTESLPEGPYRIVVAFNSASGVWGSVGIWVDPTGPPVATSGLFLPLVLRNAP
jgi:hypothetical protein